MPAVARHITAAPQRSRQSHINALATGAKPYLVPKSLPPRIRKAITAMVFDGLTRPEAAASVGIQDNTLYKHLRKPEALKHYKIECEVLRSGQRHRNIKKAMQLRDDPDAKYGGKVVIEAMKFLENDYSGDNGSNRPVNVNVTVTPGYICDISKVSERSKQILQLSGKVIEHEE